MYRRKKISQGFTLVELMLAMSFIAILLVSIAMLSIYLTTIYQRGSTMKDISQAGTEIASDIKRSIADADPTYPKFRVYDLYGVADVRKLIVMCSGAISYVINNGDALHAGDRSIRYQIDGNPIRLAKVADTDGVLCNGAALGSTSSGFGGSANNRSLKPAYQSSARELLSEDGSYTLSVWGLSFSAYPASDPELATIALTIGTSEAGELDRSITPEHPYPTCNIGNGSEWCGINTFTIVGRSGNDQEK